MRAKDAKTKVCPWCGSEELEVRKEYKGSKTISEGLPEKFKKNGWKYFICSDCFKKYQTNFDNNVDFIFTVVKGKYFLFIGRSQSWVQAKEVVEFT